MKFQGALIKEQGVTFGIIVVKPSVLRDENEATTVRHFGTKAFGFIPIILMAQDLGGRATYLGRRDIVNYLCRVPLSAIPWREYTVS